MVGWISCAFELSTRLTLILEGFSYSVKGTFFSEGGGLMPNFIRPIFLI